MMPKYIAQQGISLRGSVAPHMHSAASATFLVGLTVSRYTPGVSLEICRRREHVFEAQRFAMTPTPMVGDPAPGW